MLIDNYLFVDTVILSSNMGPMVDHRVRKNSMVMSKYGLIFTRGQFWPSGIVVACVCVCLSVNHELVRTITRQPFQLGSPNLDQRCKRPWLRSLLFWEVIDLDLQGQIQLRSQNWPHFELVQPIIHHLFKLGFPNLVHKCILAPLRSL